MQVLTETRAEHVDHSAAELRRIERDLHDGAQARLVALSMSLGMAEQPDGLRPRDGAADDRRRPVDDQRPRSATCASVVRGIHPPVLADRGIAGAVEALALDMAIPVTDRRRAARAAAGPGRVGRLLRASPSASPTSASTPAPRNALDHAGPRRRACCGRSSATTAVGGADPDAGTGMRGSCGGWPPSTAR